MAAPRTIIIPAAKQPHRATLICLHGLGDSGAGWTFLAENWRKRGKFEDVAFIFPSAPAIPITLNGGMRMPGWYDIARLGEATRSGDEPGILKSREYVHSLINEQIKDGVPADRIILGGFSQGGAISLFAGLTFPQRLAGIFGLSCYQLIQDKFNSLREETGNVKTPVFMGHGDADPMVKIEWGRATAEGIKEAGVELEFHEYPGLPHGAHPDEIDELEKWVARQLGGESKA